jgi:hypothetical protein
MVMLCYGGYVMLMLFDGYCWNSHLTVLWLEYSIIINNNSKKPNFAKLRNKTRNKKEIERQKKRGEKEREKETEKERKRQKEKAGDRKRKKTTERDRNWIGWVRLG